MTSDHNPIDTTRTVTLSCGHLGNPLNIDGIKGIGICKDGCGTQGIRSRNIPAWEPRTGSYTQDTNGNICVRETEKGATTYSSTGAVDIAWRCGCRVHSGITRTTMKQCGGTPAPKPAPNYRAPKPAPNYYARAVAVAAVSAVLFGVSVGALLAGVHGISSPTWYVVALVVNLGNFIGAGVIAARADRETNTGRNTR